MVVLVTNLRQARYKVVGIGILGSLNDLLICGIRLAQADVVTDATAEQNRFLGHDANILTQPVEVEAGDVLTIKFHLHRNNVTILASSQVMLNRCYTSNVVAALCMEF